MPGSFASRVAWLVAALASLSAAARGDQPVEQKLRDAENDWECAVLCADVPTFERLLGDEFVHVSHTGKLRTRGEWLANHSLERLPYESLNTSELRIRVYGRSAVVTGKIAPTGTSSAGTPISGKYRFIRVWQKTGDLWQLAAMQSTRVAADEQKGPSP